MNGIIIAQWVFSFFISVTIVSCLAHAINYWLGLGFFNPKVVDWNGDMWDFLYDFFNKKRGDS